MQSTRIEAILRRSYYNFRSHYQGLVRNSCMKPTGKGVNIGFGVIAHKSLSDCGIFQLCKYLMAGEMNIT